MRNESSLMYTASDSLLLSLLPCNIFMLKDLEGYVMLFVIFGIEYCAFEVHCYQYNND